MDAVGEDSGEVVPVQDWSESSSHFEDSNDTDFDTDDC